MSLKIDSHSYSQSLFLNHLVNVFQYLDNLRHYNNPFNDLLENERHFDQSFFVSNNLYRNIYNAIYDLKYFLNMVDISDNLLEFFKDDCFFYDLFYLLD